MRFQKEFMSNTKKSVLLQMIQQLVYFSLPFIPLQFIFTHYQNIETAPS